MNDSYFETDLRGNMTFFNSIVPKSLGYSPEEMAGMNHRVYMDPENAEIVEGSVRDIYRKNIPSKVISYEVIRKDRTKAFVETSFSLIKNKDGQSIGYRGVSRDITERKRAEKELEDSRNMLIRSEKLAAIGQLSAGVAHEILNPINIMGMKLQMLEMTEAISEKTKDAIRTCEEQIKKVTNITKDLQQFARVSEKQITSSNINELIEQVLSLMRPRLKVEDVKVDARYQADIPRVPLDRDRMGQVILNLINNALDAMKGQPERVLRVTTELTGKNVIRLSFSDTGTGIPPKILGRIFDPFFTTKEEGKGTGLGLSISYGIIQDHNGTIRAENNAEGGATFFLELPVGESSVS